MPFKVGELRNHRAREFLVAGCCLGMGKFICPAPGSEGTTGSSLCKASTRWLNRSTRQATAERHARIEPNHGPQRHMISILTSSGNETNVRVEPIDPAAGHIHVGPTDGTGPVMIPFASVSATGSSGSFAAADYTTGDGLPADWAGVLDAIRDGNAYVNIHTAANQAGEIRGQLQGSVAPPPTDTVATAEAPAPVVATGLLVALALVALTAFVVSMRRTARR